MSLLKSIQRFQVARAIAVVLLLVMVGIGAVPGYLSGQWSWSQLPKIPHLSQIRKLQRTGLEIPGWKTLEQKAIAIGGHQWSYQQIQGDYPKPIQLLILPPGDSKAQPQVEWVDIDGSLQWQTDSYTRLKFDVETSVPTERAALEKTEINQKQTNDSDRIAEVEARFFRAWTQQQTFAVLQWYAWPEGGNPAPSSWFWVDQLAQLHRRRVPWVAVCLQIPIEPLGDVKASRPLAESLGKMVQAALITGPFAGASRAL